MVSKELKVRFKSAVSLLAERYFVQDVSFLRERCRVKPVLSSGNYLAFLFYIYLYCTG